MPAAPRVIRNEEVAEVALEVPEGHAHLRAVIRLADGSELVFQEATVANLVRAYVSIKTHPQRRRTRLVGRRMTGRKPGFAEWQLVEEDQ